MNFRHLECFFAVADELHFGRAATKLHLSQASVSEAVKALERSLGGKLFVRTTRTVRLTSFGRRFLHEARGPFDRLSTTYQLAKAVHRGRDEVVIGHTPELGQVLFPRLIELLTTHQPVKPSFVWKPILMHTHAQIRAVTEGRIDVGLCWVPGAPDPLSATVLAVCPFAIILRADDPLAARDELRLRDLQGRRLVVSRRQDNLVIDARLQAAMLQSGLSASSLDEVLGYDELAIHVAARGCIGLHPATVSLVNRIPGMLFRPLVEPTLKLEISAVYRSGTTNIHVEPMISALTQVAAAAVSAISGVDPGLPDPLTQSLRAPSPGRP